MSIHWKDARLTTLKKLVSMDRIGLVTDMDGTISYIVEDPEEAVVTPRNCQLLQQLREKVTLLSVVSGRSLRSVAERMQMPGVVYIGNHGLERYENGQVKYNFDEEKYRPRLESAIKELQKIQLDGVQVEDKGITATIHYRQAEGSQAAYGLLLPLVQKIATQQNLDFFEGRMIFELRPPVKADKGSAFEGLVHEFSLDGALYIGDDTTDIAALKMARQLRQKKICFAIGAGVMSNDHPEELLIEADLLTFGVPDVENLFAWILENLN
jgi:trehalose 6-phosphate phosphatase